jgi:hypothetical protein
MATSSSGVLCSPVPLSPRDLPIEHPSPIVELRSGSQRCNREHHGSRECPSCAPPEARAHVREPSRIDPATSDLDYTLGLESPESALAVEHAASPCSPTTTVAPWDAPS